MKTRYVIDEKQRRIIRDVVAKEARLAKHLQDLYEKLTTEKTSNTRVRELRRYQARLITFLTKLEALIREAKRYKDDRVFALLAVQDFLQKEIRLNAKISLEKMIDRLCAPRDRNLFSPILDYLWPIYENDATQPEKAAAAQTAIEKLLQKRGFKVLSAKASDKLYEWLLHYFNKTNEKANLKKVNQIVNPKLREAVLQILKEKKVIRTT